MVLLASNYRCGLQVWFTGVVYLLSSRRFLHRWVWRIAGVTTRAGGCSEIVVETVCVEEATESWEMSSMLSREHIPESKLGISGPPLVLTLFFSVLFSLFKELGVIIPFMAGFLYFSGPLRVDFLGVLALLNSDFLSVSLSSRCLEFLAFFVSFRALRITMFAGFLTLIDIVTTVTFDQKHFTLYYFNSVFLYTLSL